MAQQQLPGKKKKAYVTPALTEYGSVAKLTETKPGSRPDGMSAKVRLTK